MKMLANGKAEYVRDPKELSWLDVQPYHEIINNTMPPRVFTTHLAPSWLPPKLRWANQLSDINSNH